MLIIGFEVNTYCATQIGDLDSLATWVIFVYMQTPLYCMGIGISVGIRGMVSWILEIEGNSKAKHFAKIYYLYTSFMSILIAILILFKGKEISGFFT